MNELKLSGRAISAYMSDSGALVVKLLVTHGHKIGHNKTVCESVFNVVMTDADKIPYTNVQAGDDVIVTGHIKADLTITAGGNNRKKVMVYADDIEQDIRSGFRDKYI